MNVDIWDRLFVNEVNCIRMRVWVLRNVCGALRAREDVRRDDAKRGRCYGGGMEILCCVEQ